MKQNITTISLIFSALLILDSMDVAHALAMFVIAGQIPGTNIALDADTMMSLCLLIIGFGVGRLTLRIMAFFSLPYFHRQDA